MLVPTKMKQENELLHEILTQNTKSNFYFNNIK